MILPAHNFNEQEYLIISKELKKAGVQIFTASDSYSVCIGMNGLKVKNDVSFYNIHESNFNGIIFIGGIGIKDYWNNSFLHSCAQKFVKNKKIVGAICSAPVILAKAGLLKGNAVCYPEDKNELEVAGIKYVNEPVVKNENIITGRDPASASEFTKIFLHELTKES
jgi:protease I